MHRVLIIDNYDSFTFNLYQSVSSITGSPALVKRNDEIDIEFIQDYSPSHLIISPGPGHPQNPRDFGISSLILKSEVEFPILGVCLGHQGLGYVKGATIKNAKKIVHGKTSIITHNAKGVFKDIPNPFEAGRYHSLAIYNPPPSIEVTATAEDGEIMGIQDLSYSRYGIQFHPESILTPQGERILSNFLRL